MKKHLILTLLFAFVLKSNAQTFVCTDFKYVGHEITQMEIQKEKNRTLGKEAVLTIYDKSLRYSFDGNSSKIFDKIRGDEYQLIDKYGEFQTRRRVIKLHKIFAYTKGFTLESYIDNKYQGSVTFKRK